MKKVFILLAFSILFLQLNAQDNYEIQVYASPTMATGMSIIELHSNFVFDGIREVKDGVIPSQHALHETLEFTHGVTKNFEIGFYLFTNYTAGYGYQFVGSHIRPRFTAPDRWKLPVGLSLSAELGTQKKKYASDYWSLELRPIIDKQWKRIYLSLNPVLGVALKGAANDQAPAFTPNIKFSYSVNPKVSAGLEYYGETGTLSRFDPINTQSHALFLAFDLFTDPRWEFNFAPGVGLTPSTDKFVFKSYIGRRINWRSGKKQ